ncbi:MAG: hypothetical protein AABY95_07045 [Pseudomonadota bacterium]
MNNFLRGFSLLLCLMSGQTLAQPCEMVISLETVFAEVSQPQVFDWQGTFVEDAEVCFPSRQSGAQLKSWFVAPEDVETRPAGSTPVVVIGPGSVNGLATYYRWSARELANHGYLVLVVDPQGVGRSEIVELGSCGATGCPGVPFQQASNYVDALASGIDFAFTREHPWLAKADLSRIGIAGHSLSARAATFLGGLDQRVGAVVAWDHMASDLHGDAGTPSGEGVCANLIGGEIPGTSEPVTPRAPTMGQASDANGTCNFETNIANTGPNGIGSDPELKKTGYEHWRAAGIPSMVLVFNAAAHGNWAQSQREGVSEQLQLFQHYTRAWFDLYLKGDESARGRLAANEVLGLPLAQHLSSKFRSALFMPEKLLDCADLVAGLCLPGTVPVLPPIVSAPDSEGGGGILLGGIPPLTIALILIGVFFRARKFISSGEKR